MNQKEYFMNMLRSGGNPEQIVEQMLQNQNNPILANLIKCKNPQQIEQFARNICRQRGVDFDKEFAAFRKEIGM